MSGVRVDQLKFSVGARLEHKRRKVQHRYDGEIGFFNWRLSKYCVESVILYGDMSHAYDLCLKDA